MTSTARAGSQITWATDCLQLLNLVVEVDPQGVRVIDRGRVHQHHVAVRGMCASLAAQGAVSS